MSLIYPEIAQYLEEAGKAGLLSDRKTLLDNLADYIVAHAPDPANLVFICTHNSRRSHMGQLWALAASRYFGLDFVETFSGGTEATAFNPNAIASMRRAGFRISGSEKENPRYEVRYGDDHPPELVWSKTYDDPANPKRDFCAIMTCDEAHEACPLILGATKRIPLFYQDPKISDGTPGVSEVYDARCAQIAGEMMYVMRGVSDQHNRHIG